MAAEQCAYDGHGDVHQDEVIVGERELLEALPAIVHDVRREAHLLEYTQKNFLLGGQICKQMAERRKEEAGGGGGGEKMYANDRGVPG